MAPVPAPTARPAEPAGLVTLTGGAGAGKTTLAAALSARHRAAIVLHLDDYYVTDLSRGVWIPDDTGTPRLDVGDPRRAAHDRYIEPARQRCDLVVDAQLPTDDLAAQLQQMISRQRAVNF